MYKALLISTNLKNLSFWFLSFYSTWTVKHFSQQMFTECLASLVFKRMFIYLFWERDTAAYRQRERKRESQAGSTLSAQSPMRGSNPRTVRSWVEVKLWVGCLTNWATWVPLEIFNYSLTKQGSQKSNWLPVPRNGHVVIDHQSTKL